MSFEFKKAVRKSVPMLVSISGTSGSGKTYSSILLAAGIAGPNGRVGLIDTENGRGSMYADSPGIMAALPNGFEIVQMDAPYDPDRYIEALTAAEKAGITVCVVDSTTHEWEGMGGCCEIAEKFKLKGMPNWAKAKMAHKRFMNHALSSKMDIIFCLRARDKVKIVKVSGREEIVPIGIQPITEKNFVFEMLLSLQLDEATKHATAIKVPEALVSVFPSGQLITKEQGERIRQWNEGGRPEDPAVQVRKRAKAAAENGVAAYHEFWVALTVAQRKAIGEAAHAENKAVAEEADFLAEQERLGDGEPVPELVEQ